MAPQSRLPVGDEPLERIPAEPATLPDAVVRVLDGHLGELGLSAGTERIVGRAQLGDQEALGPAVTRDVVGDQQQNVVLGSGS